MVDVAPAGTQAMKAPHGCVGAENTNFKSASVLGGEAGIDTDVIHLRRHHSPLDPDASSSLDTLVDMLLAAALCVPEIFEHGMRVICAYAAALCARERGAWESVYWESCVALCMCTGTDRSVRHFRAWLDSFVSENADLADTH